MARRTLVLGQLPPQRPATPQATAQAATRLIPAGVWCVVGREGEYPGWEQAFAFPPDPFDPATSADAAAVLDAAAREAKALAASCLPRLAARLRPESALPAAYWDVALAPWLIMATQLVVGYQHRLRALIAAYGGEELDVPLLPEDMPLGFTNEQAFIFHGSLGAAFTHWLLSTLLRAQWPAAWRAVEMPAPAGELCPPPGNAPGRTRDPGARLRQLGQRLLMTLPFPRVRGFGLRQSLLLSRALWANRNSADASRSLAEAARDWGPVPALPLDPVPLLWRCLPLSLKEARYPSGVRVARRRRIRVASISAWEDTAYRMQLAAWRAAGHKLVFIQHGGNYGQVRTAAFTPLLEYVQHAFITWGWHAQGPERGNFVPLPAPLLEGVCNAHAERTPTLLYVGTEISVFPYRMDSRPTPRQYVRYRAAKVEFFAALPVAVQARCLYRPYFSVPGTLADAEWLLPRFPALQRCVGPLEPHMLGCRLLVLDHHGTTLLQALAANVPLVVFWEREAWALCPECAELLPALRDAGIWHPDARSAAAHVARVWETVPAWWCSEPVQAARRLWRERYALTTDVSPAAQAAGGLDALWARTLQAL